MDPPVPALDVGGSRAKPRAEGKKKKERREPGSELGADRDAIKREVIKARALSEKGVRVPGEEAGREKGAAGPADKEAAAVRSLPGRSRCISPTSLTW